MSEDQTCTDASPRCPECGAGSLPIVWGLPGPETSEALSSGLLRAGGCVIPATTPLPNWSCVIEGHPFYDADEERCQAAIEAAFQ